MALTLALVLLAASGAVSVRAQPPFLASDASDIQLEVLVLDDTGAPSASAKVSLSANTGVVGPLQALGGGRFRATYAPPARRFPQVALLLAEVSSGARRERGWLAIPIHGTKALKIKTKPRAKVTVTVAEKVFGPVEADASGNAGVSVVAPPGVSSGSLRSVDRLGNANVKPLNLEPPPFPRLRLAAAAERPAASWADGAPLPIEIFAVEPDGRPLAEARIAVKADRGSVGAVSGAKRGVYLCAYRAPERVENGFAELRAALANDSSPGAMLRVELRPGPPARAQLTLSPAEVVAGAGTAVQVRAAAFDAKGNAVDPALRPDLSADFGEVAAAGAGWLLRIPDAFGGRERSTVRASFGSASAEALLALRPGPPAAGDIAVDRRMVRAGGRAAQVSVSLRDAFGNPVPGERLVASSTAGRAEELRELGRGQYALSFLAGAEEAPGRATLKARAERGGVTLEAPLSILPYQRPWSMAAGVLLEGTHNLVRSRGGGPLVELGVRLNELPIEALLQGGVRLYRDVGPLDAGVGDGIQVAASYRGLYAAAGLRASFPLSPSANAHVSALGGMQSTSSALSYADGVGSGPSLSASRWSPIVSAGAGASYRMGPGRLVGELRGSYGAARGYLVGNLGGVSLAAGYLFDLR